MGLLPVNESTLDAWAREIKALVRIREGYIAAGNTESEERIIRALKYAIQQYLDDLLYQ